MTLQTLKILRVLLDHPLQEHYGLEIAKAAGLPSGTIYPPLAKLELMRWVTSDWEQVDPHKVGRPRRRYYRLTPEGAVRAKKLIDATLERLSPQTGRGGKRRASDTGPIGQPGWSVGR